VHADLRHRTYARFRIGTVSHNPDVVCTTYTRVEMQLIHVQLGDLGSEVITRLCEWCIITLLAAMSDA